MGKLTTAQREMLNYCLASDAAGGITMFDGVMAGVASRLAVKGFVSLPAGHGIVFGAYLQRVQITDAGRHALSEGEQT